MNPTYNAAEKISRAIDLLQSAKRDLLRARGDQQLRLRLEMVSVEIMEIEDILLDPVCTPEIAVGGSE